MSPNARRRALRAAAAVAAISVAGCGPRKTAEVASTTSPVATESGEREGPDPAELTVEPTAADVQSASTLPEAEAACAAEVASLGKADANGIVKLPDSAKECCATLDAYYSEHMDEMMGWETRNQCCDLTDWSGGLACTPWGPPTPPAFESRA